MKSLLLLLIFFIPAFIFSQNIDLNDLNNDRTDYYKSRGILFSADSLTRLGFDIVLNEKEQQLDSYLKELQRDYIDKSGAKFPPANYFYKYRYMIDTSIIYKTFQKMPKGALLHIHSTAMGDAEWLVKNASYMDNCYFYNSDDGKETYGTVHFFAEGKAPANWVLVKELRDKDPDFDNKLLKLLTFSASDEGSAVIWEDFEKIFNRMSGLIEYLPVYKEYKKNALEILLKDNVQHVELRTGMHGIYDLNKEYSYLDFAKMYSDVISELQVKYPQFTSKLIFAGWRGNTPGGVMKYIETAFAIKKKYPNLLVGFDLVGEEDAGHSTEYFLNEFLKKDSLEKVYNSSLPFYFHDGESTLPSDLNLYDAIALKTKRIGHGINLFRFPILEQIAKRDNICLEVSPLSNQILGYVQNLRMHPASGYINKGIPVAISSDDPQIFNYKGLSYDFWTAYMAWELDLKQVKRLALNSLMYSALDKNEYDIALHYFLSEWDKWVDASVK
jgi:adenosine deaminase CECR1